MVVVEGVARKLDPHLDIWATAEPVVGGWIAENLGPRGRIEDLSRSVSQLVRLAADAPPSLERLSRLIEREADATPAEAPSEPGRGRWPATVGPALWIIAAALAWIAFHWR
jgi:ubiquinone biosynthesis protein